MRLMLERVLVLAVVLSAGSGHAQVPVADPFADLASGMSSATNAPALTAPGWGDNLLLRKEVYLLFALGSQDLQETDDAMTRVSLGFELQKRGNMRRTTRMRTSTMFLVNPDDSICGSGVFTSPSDSVSRPTPMARCCSCPMISSWAQSAIGRRRSSGR